MWAGKCLSAIFWSDPQRSASFLHDQRHPVQFGRKRYIGFLYALLGNPESITLEDLQTDALRTQMTELLAGVERSSGSSDWLKDMFLDGGYDAMVNYECLMIQANEELESRGEETLYVVYPYDGLTLADSPLGYVDDGDEDKEEAFLKLQEYLLSEEVQNEIQRTGRRTGYTGISEENRDVFRTDWGLQPDRVLSTMRMPSTDVLFEALNLYQTDFKKPSLNITAWIIREACQDRETGSWWQRWSSC